MAKMDGRGARIVAQIQEIEGGKVIAKESVQGDMKDVVMTGDVVGILDDTSQVVDRVTPRCRVVELSNRNAMTVMSQLTMFLDIVLHDDGVAVYGDDATLVYDFGDGFFGGCPGLWQIGSHDNMRQLSFSSPYGESVARNFVGGVVTVIEDLRKRIKFEEERGDVSGMLPMVMFGADLVRNEMILSMMLYGCGHEGEEGQESIEPREFSTTAEMRIFDKDPVPMAEGEELDALVGRFHEIVKPDWHIFEDAKMLTVYAVRPDGSEYLPLRLSILKSDGDRVARAELGDIGEVAYGPLKPTQVQSLIDGRGRIVGEKEVKFPVVINLGSRHRHYYGTVLTFEDGSVLNVVVRG